MNPTLKLLAVISVPPEKEGNAAFEFLKLHQHELYRYAIMNRISTLYLEALNENWKIHDTESLYKREESTWLKTMDLIAECSRLLSASDIDHVIFKTIRPYRFTTVDIDVLVLGKRTQYVRASKCLMKAGFRLVVRGPRSTTLNDPWLHMGIDLYEEIAISSTIYIDKEKLFDSVQEIRLPNHGSVKTLTREADMATVIAHSLVKEQMYPLSEYYTFIHHLNEMDVSKFIQILEENNLTTAARGHTTLSAILHYHATGTIPDKLKLILESFGISSLESKLSFQRHLKMPHKYSLITVGRSLLEIMKGRKCRNSMAAQILRTLDPVFAQDLLNKSIDHLMRETY